MKKKAPNGSNGQPRQVPSQVLAVAAQLFRRRGYAGTSTREIAAALGVQKASLYHYTSSKEELLFQLCKEALDESIAGARNLESIVDPVDRLRALVSFHLGTTLRNRDKHQTMLIELRALPAGPRAVVVKLRDEYQGIVRGMIEEAQRSGHISDRFEARYLALSLLNLLNWTIFWYKPGGPMTVAQVSELTSEVFLSGVLSGDRVASTPARK